MPTENNIELGTGEFYMIPLDGGSPVRVGRVTEATQTVERTDYLNELGEPVPVLVPTLETATFECEIQPITLDLVTIWRLTHDIRVVLVWAQENRPKLLHLATYAKSSRKRRKNIIRILRDFFEEVQHREKN